MHENTERQVLPALRKIPRGKLYMLMKTLIEVHSWTGTPSKGTGTGESVLTSSFSIASLETKHYYTQN